MIESDTAISVIVPVYKVEKYLDKCVKSILNQTFRDFELLLVDDGSPDQCGAMCDAYAAKDSRIKVLHKKNGGLSDARNYGMQFAKGEYFTFIDSDDFIEPSYLEVLYQLVTKYQVKISAVSTNNVQENADYEPKCQESISKKAGIEEGIRRMLVRDPFGIAAWGKLYHRALFQTVQYPVGRLYEDMLTTPYLFDQCDAIAFSDAKLYCYLERNDSIMHRPVKEKDLQAFEGMQLTLDYLEKKYSGLHEASVCRYTYDTIGVIFSRLIWHKDYLKIAKQIKKRDRSAWKEALHNPYLKKGKKLQLLLMLINLRLYQAVYMGKAKILKSVGRKKNV